PAGIAARDRHGQGLPAASPGRPQRPQEQQIRLILEQLDPAGRQLRQFVPDPSFFSLPPGREPARSAVASRRSLADATADGSIAASVAFRPSEPDAPAGGARSRRRRDNRTARAAP